MKIENIYKKIKENFLEERFIFIAIFPIFLALILYYEGKYICLANLIKKYYIYYITATSFIFEVYSSARLQAKNVENENKKFRPLYLIEKSNYLDTSSNNNDKESVKVLFSEASTNIRNVNIYYYDVNKVLQKHAYYPLLKNEDVLINQNYYKTFYIICDTLKGERVYTLVNHDAILHYIESTLDLDFTINYYKFKNQTPMDIKYKNFLANLLKRFINDTKFYN